MPMSEPVDLAGEARLPHAALKANRANGMTDDNALDVAAMCIAEEAGEVVGAYRRWAGKAHRSGPLEDVEHEIADVIFAAAVLAEQLGVNLNQALRAKLGIIWSRGWKA
jgi:NTP pyrophosphatase (non-canonical NTP hydrolase)